MKLLIDTHIALWSVLGNDRLSREADRLMHDASAVYVSVVTIWEIAIKHALRRKRHDAIVVSGGQATRLFDQAGFAILPITAAHAAAIDDLPPLHGDPFDRMLMAQALSEPMRLLTHDARLKAYSELVTVG